MGLGARLVVMLCRGGFYVEVPVIVLRVYLGSVTSFWSTFVLGGGGNVTFHGNSVPAGNTLSLMSALYLWATLGCGVFGCHGNLV